MTGSTMTASTEPDNIHASGPRRRDPVDTVLDHKTITRSDVESFSSKEKKIGGRLGARHHHSAEDVGIKKSPKVGNVRSSVSRA